MAAPGNPEQNPAGYHGFAENLLGLLGSASGYLHARLKLLQLESKEVLVHVLVMAFLLGAAVALVFLGYIFLIGALVMLVYAWTGIDWPWVLLAFGGGHLILAFALVLAARARFTRKMFEETLHQLRRDKEWLSKTQTD